MPKPVLIINGHDYAPFIEEMEISRNDLDADGSGRDVLTGLMYRTRVATKAKLEIKKTLPLPGTVMRQLMADLKPQFYTATYLDPETNVNATRTFYTSALQIGVPRYNRWTGETKYDGVSFEMIER